MNTEKHRIVESYHTSMTNIMLNYIWIKNKCLKLQGGGEEKWLIEFHQKSKHFVQESHYLRALKKKKRLENKYFQVTYPKMDFNPEYFSKT